MNGRQWQQLIALSPGVIPGAPGESGSPNPVNVDGQRIESQSYIWSTAFRRPLPRRGAATASTFRWKPCASSPSRRELIRPNLETWPAESINLQSKSGHEQLARLAVRILPQRQDWMRRISSPTRPANRRIRFDTTSSADRSAARSGVTRRSSSPIIRAQSPTARLRWSRACRLDAAAPGRFLRAARRRWGLGSDLRSVRHVARAHAISG